MRDLTRHSELNSLTEITVKTLKAEISNADTINYLQIFLDNVIQICISSKIGKKIPSRRVIPLHAKCVANFCKYFVSIHGHHKNCGNREASNKNCYRLSPE